MMGTGDGPSVDVPSAEAQHPSLVGDDKSIHAAPKIQPDA